VSETPAGRAIWGKITLYLLAAGVRDLGRRGDLYAKMSHMTQKSKRAQKSHYYSWLRNRTDLPEEKNGQLVEPAEQLSQLKARVSGLHLAYAIFKPISAQDLGKSLC
jgi:hypothetical protein